MAGNLTSTSTPILYDPVYYGYIPTSPSPDFTLPKPISEMKPQEKTQTMERFASRLKNALHEEEEENILQGVTFWKDEHHKAMMVALARGDEFLAEEIIKRDRADIFTIHRSGMPTATTDEVKRLGEMLAVLFSLPSEVKHALLHGNFPALVGGTSRILSRKVPATPPMRSKAVPANQKPYIYVLHLVNKRFDNPNMQKMRTIIDYTKAYLRHVKDSPGGIPMRVIATQNYRATAQSLEQVLQIERAKMRQGGALLPGALTRTGLENALQEGRTEVPCLYITSNDQSMGIRKIVELMEASLDKLVRDGWDPTSPNPLPTTIASSGWTFDAGKRQYDYYSHSGINGKIRIFDAISHALGYNGLSWQCIFTVWNKQAVSMAEHIAHVLGGTYVIQGGMNGEAAGISVKSKEKISDACYEEMERKLLNSSHWCENRDATDSRNRICRTTLDSLQHYLTVEREVSEALTEEADLENQFQEAKKQQLAQDMKEVEALDDRIRSTDQLLDDIDNLDERLQELQLVRDTIYAVPGTQDLVRDERHAYRSEHSQVGFSQGATQALAKFYGRKTESTGLRIIQTSSPPPLPSQDFQGYLGGNDNASSPAPDSARDEGPDDLYNVTPKR